MLKEANETVIGISSMLVSKRYENKPNDNPIANECAQRYCFPMSAPTPPRIPAARRKTNPSSAGRKAGIGKPNFDQTESTAVMTGFDANRITDKDPMPAITPGCTSKK